MFIMVTKINSFKMLYYFLLEIHKPIFHKKKYFILS